MKQIGIVTHYYDKIGVAIVKFNKVFKAGGEIVFGEDGLRQVVSSMQLEHEQIEEAKKDQEVGIKIESEVKKGTSVFEA